MTQPPADGGDTHLSIQDDDDGVIEECEYIGQERKLSNTYLLVFNGEQRTCDLEPLTSRLDFNMTSAPWERDPARLAEQYRAVDSDNERQSSAEPTASSGGEDLSGNESDTPPDASNPFDYRHYLSAIPGATAAVTVASTQAISGSSPAVTPMSRLTPTTKTTMQRAVPRKELLARKPKPLPMAPKVRLERRASIRQRSPAPSDADDGGLTIEMDEGIRPRKRPTTFLGTGQSRRPISLRSAANSASPAIHASPSGQEAGSGSEEDAEDELGHSDADVDVLALPSPAIADGGQAQREDMEMADDEIDLEAEFEQALQSAAEDEAAEAVAVPAARAVRRDAESEESEEE